MAKRDRVPDLGKESTGNLMKFEVSLLAALMLIGTELLARVSAQGIEQALTAAVIEYGLNGVRAGRRLLRNAHRLRG
jgi:hypothetical protein